MLYKVTFDKNYKHYHLIENVEVLINAKKVNQAKKRGYSRLRNETVKIYKEKNRINNERIFREYINILPIIVKDTIELDAIKD